MSDELLKPQESGEPTGPNNWFLRSQKKSDELSKSQEPGKPDEPASTDDPFESLIQETQTNPNLSDEEKKQAIAALSEGQAEERRQTLAWIQSLKHRIPDRDYAPEVVATIAATLLRGDHFRAGDCELAIAGALRLLDTTYRILERHKRWRASGAEQCEPEEERISFGEAMKKITGADRPGKAEERYVGRLLREDYEFTDHHEFSQARGSRVQDGHDPLARPKILRRKLTEEEIAALLAPYREEGFTLSRIQQLLEGYRERTSRSRAGNFQKKRTIPEKGA